MPRLMCLVVLLLASLPTAPVRAEQGFIAIAYHDVVSEGALGHETDPFTVSAENLAAHFAWLQHHGYTPVSIDDLIAASSNARPLPEKAVLLTFDDGLTSLYTQVYPLLKLFGYPAVASVVTDWLDHGHEQLPRDAFISWEQAREMQASGLVEFASHSADLHHGIASNPQHNLMPAGAARAYRGGEYESADEFQTRIAADLQRSAASIEAALGTPPRIMTWPFGKYTLSNLDTAAEKGMPISMTLEVGRNSLAGLSSVRRILVRDNPGIADLSVMLSPVQRSPVIRALHAELDDVYDEDIQQLQANLDLLIERIKDLQISHVIVQPVAGIDADGTANAAYFPNRHLPVRADLFSYVAWQLKTRSDVRVFARMPLRSFERGTEGWRHMREFYQDLAVHADFDGILFQDLAGPEEGMPDPRQQDWFDLSGELIEVLRAYRPELKTAVSLCAPDAPALALSFKRALEAYDYVLLTAPPNLAVTAAQFDRGMEQTVFNLHFEDRCTGNSLAAAALDRQLRSLQAAGVKHLAVDPDDVTAIGTGLEQIRKGMSLADYPFNRR